MPEFHEYKCALDGAREQLKALHITPNDARRYGLKINLDGQRRSAYELLAYPDFDMGLLSNVWPELQALGKPIAQAVEIEASYAVYMRRQSSDIVDIQRDENRLIPDDFDYSTLAGLSNELKQKLGRQRPFNVAQAAQIDGMTPAAISLLLVHLRKIEAAQRSVA